MQFTTLFAGLLALGSFAMADDYCNAGWSFERANCDGMPGKHFYCCDPSGVQSEQFNTPRGGCEGVNGIGWVNCGNPVGGVMRCCG
ncbi:hypothetical protein LZ554_000658 [Drepanopeziza brunnea f. sp. 'monogermtubi']|nr:hypothetical protein LZ554_000658 [Drepanopeziza brunnea f. sp. 'monogermtubi']